MGVWGVVATIAAGWVLLSIVVGLAGARFFRKSPVEQQLDDDAQVQYLAAWRRGER